MSFGDSSSSEEAFRLAAMDPNMDFRETFGLKKVLKEDEIVENKLMEKRKNIESDI